MGLHIKSNTEHLSSKIPTLFPNQYFYGTMNNTSTQSSFILQLTNCNDYTIEFASYSNDTYDFIFTQADTKTPLQFTKEENAGRSNIFVEIPVIIQI